MEEAGFWLKRSKCNFLQTSVNYLGRVIDANGIHPDPAKVQAVKEVPVFKNVSELRSFLRLINCYSRFMPQRATTLPTLNESLHKQSEWQWKKQAKTGFPSGQAGLSFIPSISSMTDRNTPRTTTVITPAELLLGKTRYAQVLLIG